MQLYRDVARDLEDLVLGSVEDDRVAAVVRAADAEPNAHLREDLPTQTRQWPNETIAISFSPLLLPSLSSLAPSLSIVRVTSEIKFARLAC